MREERDELEQQGSRTTRVAVPFGLLVAAGFFAFVRSYEPQPPPPKPIPVAASQPEALPSTEIEAAPEPGPGVSGSTVPGNEVQVGIYECMRDGQRVVSDRPCGADAELRTLSVSQPDRRDVMAAQQRARSTLMAVAPGEVGSESSQGASEEVAAQGRAAPSDAGATLAVEARCAAIDSAIDGINARMRQGGYGTDEGNWLRAKWHELKKERYELKCRQTGRN